MEQFTVQLEMIISNGTVYCTARNNFLGHIISNGTVYRTARSVFVEYIISKHIISNGTVSSACSVAQTVCNGREHFTDTEHTTCKRLTRGKRNYILTRGEELLF